MKDFHILGRDEYTVDGSNYWYWLLAQPLRGPLPDFLEDVDEG